MFTVVLCPGTPEGSTGSGSGFKASQKTVVWLGTRQLDDRTIRRQIVGQIVDTL